MQSIEAAHGQVNQICQSLFHVIELIQRYLDHACLPGCLKVGVGSCLALLVMQRLVCLALFKKITDLQLQKW